MIAKPSPLLVAVAVVVNAQGEVLLALRPAHAHQGGLWEFPGGKVEAGESVAQGLARELREELGIEVLRARPLIRIRHDYLDKSVLLDVWRVEAYGGTPVSTDGLPLAWVAIADLPQRHYPAANLPILTALRLASLYLITPEPESGINAFLRSLETCLSQGTRLVQLRAKTLDEVSYRHLAQRSLALCASYGAHLLLNAAPELVDELGAHGVQLSTARLMNLTVRPLGRDKWVAASCHNTAELRHAQMIGADFVVLSPVLPTQSHPDAACMGWQEFETLADCANMPVYALGGLSAQDVSLAEQHGAQGVAAMRGIWNRTSMDK